MILSTETSLYHKIRKSVTVKRHERRHTKRKKEWEADRQRSEHAPAIACPHTIITSMCSLSSVNSSGVFHLLNMIFNILHYYFNFCEPLFSSWTTSMSLFLLLFFWIVMNESNIWTLKPHNLPVLANWCLPPSDLYICSTTTHPNGHQDIRVD